MPNEKEPRRNYLGNPHKGRGKVKGKGKGHQRRSYQRRVHSKQSIEAAGQYTEDVTRTILANLKAEGLIRKWKHSKRFSKADKEGADFLVLYRNIWVPLQVKSNVRDVVAHQLISRKPAWYPHSPRSDMHLMKKLRRYISHNRPYPARIYYIEPKTKEEHVMEVRLCMDEAYYLCEIFRAQISGKRYAIGAKQDVRAALDRLRNEGLLWWEADKYDALESGFHLTDGGFGFVRYLLTYCPEPKRYFVNQCKRFGPINWKQVVEELFGHVATQKIPLPKKQVSVEHLVFERTSWGWTPKGEA